MYGGEFAFRNRLSQLVVGRKFTIFGLFYFVFEGKFQVQAPRGGLYSEGRFNGCFLVLQKLLLVSFCVVVWVLFSVFSIFCITSLVSATPRNHRFNGAFFALRLGGGGGLYMEGLIFGILRSGIPDFLIVFVDDLKAQPAQGQAFKREVIKNCESNIVGGECTTSLSCKNTYNSKICGDARCSGLNQVCCTQKHNLC